MDKSIKKGLIFMLAAVLMMPIALVFRNSNEKLAVVILLLSMLSEIIGLVFVAVSYINRRKKKA